MNRFPRVAPKKRPKNTKYKNSKNKKPKLENFLPIPRLPPTFVHNGALASVLIV